MSLEIEKHSHLIKLKGVLKKNDIDDFRNKFKAIFKTSDSVTICIENLNSIDQFGVKALILLYTETLMQGKKLEFVGLENNNLYEHFKAKNKQQDTSLNV